jgi:hypothetical protein
MWEVLTPFIYYVGYEGSTEVVRVPQGFLTDFASIPRLAYSVIGGPTGKYGKAAVIHDWLYQNPTDADSVAVLRPEKRRRRVDQIFLEGLKVLGVSWWKRTIMYTAVRVGGGQGWKNYRRKEQTRTAGDIVAEKRRRKKK